MAVRGIRSGRGTHVEPLIRWMVFVVDVHRRFAAQVHGHLELHHGDDLTPGALCRVAKCPFNNAEIPHALSVTLPAGFGRFTAMNSISPTQIESGVSPVEGPSPDAAHCRPGVGLWRTRPPNSTVWRIFTAENCNRPRGRIFLKWQSCARLHGRRAQPARTGTSGDRVSRHLDRVGATLAKKRGRGDMAEESHGGELKDVLRETLENRGALGNVRAHLRGGVQRARGPHGAQATDISNENLIINELIREYPRLQQVQEHALGDAAGERPAGHAAATDFLQGAAGARER